MNNYKIGNIIFNVPILNASGCWCLNETQLQELYNSKLGGIVSKTCSIFSKEGHPEPNYYFIENQGVHFNSKGLPNLGYYYYKNLSNKFTDKPYIISIAFETFDKLKILLFDYDKYVNIDTLVEINLSCPNLETDIPGYDYEFINKLLVCLEGYNLLKLKFGFKLPPYFQKKQIEQLTLLFNEYENILNYIVLSNSIPNCLPLIEGKNVLTNTYGGMSGKINKHIAISNVSFFAKKLKKNIKIVGCGGIENIEDVFDYLNYGADFVQLASCFYEVTDNKLNIEKINKLIAEFYNKKNI